MVLSCALLCFAAVVGCHKTVTAPVPPPPPSLQSQVIGTWVMESAIDSSMNYGTAEKDTILFTSADYVEFKADSTLAIMAKGIAYNGSWRIDSSKLFIAGTNYLDNPDGYELPILDQHHLQLYYSQSNPGVYLEEKLNLSK